jgi:hypothetical protein
MTEPRVAPSAVELSEALAKHRVYRYEIAPHVGMHPAKLGRILNEREPLDPALAARIADAIERVLTGPS